MRTTLPGLLLALITLGCSVAGASPLRLRVLDQTGAAFPAVLVIVKSLEGKGEIFRALTEQSGRVRERELAPGLYRAIATCPYGPCETKITEFLVGGAPVNLELRVGVPPTRGNLTLVGQSSRVKVEVLDSRGRPAAAAELLVRDANAEFERWYKTDGDGEAEVEPIGLEVTFGVVYAGTLTEETVAAASIEKLRSEGKKLVIHLK